MSPAGWKLLALGFLPPTTERLGRVPSLAETLELPELAAAATAVDPDAAAEDFERLFGVEGGCPPYESSYHADPFRAGRELADISGFYLAFGAEASGPAAERPDHAGCELEFLAFLGLRRLSGDEEEAETCRRAEDAFLLDHAGRWLPTLFRAVSAAAETDFYRGQSLAGRALVEAELAARGLAPEPLRPRRPLALVESDSVSCGAG